MFSAKNYGLPKDLIEAAKRVHEKQLEKDSHGKMPSKEHVMKMLKDGMSETEMMKMHSDVDKGKLKKLVKDCKQEMKEERSTAKKVHEKQLMEYDEDGHINNPPKGMDKGTKKDRETAAKMGLKGPHLVGVGRAKQKLPPLPVKRPEPKNEEVQFTEEELAEAFAIFLEENFHVEMLTEEDLDYAFEEEFPQWLEETAAATRIKSRQQQKPGMTVSDVAKKVFFPFAKNNTKSASTPAAKTKSLIPGEDVLIKRAKEKATAIAVQSDTGGPGETGVGDKIAKAPAKKPARKQVSAKPAALARKPAPKIDYKTPVTRRGPDGTYGLTNKGREYVARKEAEKRKKPFSASKFFSQMQQDGN